MIDKPIIFLDIDGVCTSMNETPGSYLNHKSNEYGLSPKCMKNLKQLLADTNASIVISSNWRIHKNEKTIKYKGHVIKNPLIKLQHELKNSIIGYLPKTGYKQKAKALIEWFDNSEVINNYVILDDDIEENLQDESLYGINQHLVFIDFKIGLCAADVKKAKNILNIK